MTSACSLLIGLAACGLAGAAFAEAPTTPAQNFDLPRAYAGYFQPEITQCETPKAGHKVCMTPPMTAGRYRVVAIGAGNPSAANAFQALVIAVGGVACFNVKIALTAQANGMHGGCEVSLLADRPVAIEAIYQVEGATANADSPQLVIKRLPWNGVIGFEPVTFIKRPAAAGAPPAKGAGK